VGAEREAPVDVEEAQEPAARRATEEAPMRERAARVRIRSRPERRASTRTIAS